MNTWASIAEVAEDFGFTQFGGDAERLGKEIRKIVTRLHPDRTGGTFKTKRSEDKYHKAKAAIEYLKSYSDANNALVKVSDIRDIVEMISKASTPAYQEGSRSLSDRYLAEGKKDTSKRFFPAKLGSGAISSIILFLIAFPKTFIESPVLGPLVKSAQFELFSLLTMLVCGMAFLASYLGEKKLESRIEYAMSEGALREIMDEISIRARHYEGKITFSNITEAMSSAMGYRLSRQHVLFAPYRKIGDVLGLSTRPDRASIEKAALVQVQRLIENGILKKSDKPSFETTYLIDTAAVEDLESY